MKQNKIIKSRPATQQSETLRRFSDLLPIKNNCRGPDKKTPAKLVISEHMSYADVEPAAAVLLIKGETIVDGENEILTVSNTEAKPCGEVHFII
jgi:hypothetical protein